MAEGIEGKKEKMEVENIQLLQDYIE